MKKDAADVETDGRQADEQESRAAVALTVAWMLTCMSTAAGVLVVLALRLLILAFPAGGGRVHPLAQMAGVFLFVALLTGFLCLLLTPLALKVRRTRPPGPVVVGAVLIGLSPLLLLGALSLLS
jgi:hypothetical protein